MVSNSKRVNEEGFILAVVLFFLTWVSLLTLSMLHEAQLALRESRSYGTVTQQFQAAEAGLKEGELQIKKGLVGKYLRNTLTYAGYHVIYTIQQLQTSFCMTNQIAYYYRVSAQAFQNQQSTLMLQTYYSQKQPIPCKGNEPTLIREGRSSWREL